MILADKCRFNSELIQVYIDRFVMRQDAFYEQLITDTGWGYIARYAPVTEQLILNHLQGNTTLAFPPFGDDGLCKWLAWDCDSEEPYLDQIEGILKQMGMFPIREGRRRGRAGHLWLFLDSKIQAADAIRFSEEVCLHSEVASEQIEFFPKQEDAAAMANPLRGPLGVHRKPGAGNARGWFEGPEKNITSQLQWLALQPLSSGVKIKQNASRLRLHDEFLARYTYPRDSRAQPIDLDSLSHLNPKEKHDYYILDCPDCEQREAFLYKDGHLIICNRRDKCKFKMSVNEYLKRFSQ